MADSKITALTAISTVDPTADPLVIVDVSDTSMAASGTTKKSTINQLLGSGGTATLASATITGDLTVDTSTLKVDSANNRVGIGTATPGYLLDVQAATAVANILSTTGTNTAYLQISNTGGYFYLGRENSAGTTFAAPAYSAVLYAAGAYPLVTTVNGGERYRIASDGVATWSNVGGVAGTAMTLNSTGLGVGTSPATSSKIHTLGNGTNVYAIFQNGDTLATNKTSQLWLSNGPTFLGANNREYRIVNIGTSATAADLVFDYWTGTAIAERMRIDSSGNVISNVTGTAPTLATNSQMVLNLTSNTNLRISVRGTDGVTRTADLTLAP